MEAISKIQHFQIPKILLLRTSISRVENIEVFNTSRTGEVWLSYEHTKIGSEEQKRVKLRGRCIFLQPSRVKRKKIQGLNTLTDLSDNVQFPTIQVSPSVEIRFGGITL